MVAVYGTVFHFIQKFFAGNIIYALLARLAKFFIERFLGIVPGDDILAGKADAPR